MNTLSPVRLLVLMMGLLVLAQSADAACASPPGNAGDMGYAGNYGTMVFCDGTRWVSMAGGVSLTVNTGGGGGATPAGSSADVQFNSSGALGADSGNFTYSSGLLTTPNLSTGNVSATTINATGLGTMGSLLVAGGATVTGQASLTVISTSLIQVGNSGASCTSSLAGGVRYNSVSNTVDYCSGTAWLSLGPSATAIPAFSAYKTVDQSVVTSTPTKVTFGAVRFDTNNNFSTDTSTFTPSIPGFYLVTANLFCSAATSGCQVAIFKNGSNYMVSQVLGAGDLIPTVSAIVQMNGTTDYLEVYGNSYDTSSPLLKAGAVYTNFSAALLTMNGGGGGGSTANPAGSTNDVQFNSGGLLAADSGNFTYTTATGTLSTTTVSTTRINVAPSVSTVISLNGGSGNMISSGSAVVSTSSAGSITIYTGGVPAMTVGSNGYVGIAQPQPQAPLDISGSWARIKGGENEYTGLAIESHYTSGLGISFVDSRMSNGNPDSSIFFGHPSDASSFMSFFTQPSGSATDRRAERMRIDGSGNIGFNWPTPADGSPNPGFVFWPSGVMAIGNNAAASGTNFIVFRRSGSAIGGISQNGTTAVAYNTTSDRRVKEDITDTREGLQELMRLPVRDFAFRKDPSHTIVTGFIAQELERVFPEAVTTNGDDGETLLKDKSKPWAVDYGRVTPLIVKGVQEFKLESDARYKVLKADNDNLASQLKAANDNIDTLQHQLKLLQEEMQTMKQARH